MGPKRGRSGPSPSQSTSSSSSMERPLLLVRDHQDAAPSEQEEEVEWWASSSVHHDRDQGGVGSGTGRRGGGGGTNHVRDREGLHEGRERRPLHLIDHADDPSMAFGGGGEALTSSRIRRGVLDDDGLGDTDAFPSRRHPQGDAFEHEFGGPSPLDALPPSRRHSPTDEEEQHKPLRTLLYRCLLMAGIVGNAALALVLLASVVVGAVVAAEQGRSSHPPRGTSYSFDSTILLRLRNASSDGGDGPDSSHGASPGTSWLWLVSMLAAAHVATALALATAVAVAAGATQEPPRRVEEDPRGSAVAAATYDGMASCAVANRGCEGDDDDDDDDDHCCCGCGRRHRPLCASTAAAALSGVLLLPAYLALSLLAALGTVTCRGVVWVPDVVKAHGAAALLAIAALHAVQARTALLYRRQLRLLLLLPSDETGRRSSSSRARPPSSRPWWWQAGATTDAPDGERVVGDGDGWFGWLRLQGRKSSSSSSSTSRFRWLRGRDNPRDDGSVDFASVQEEWMNRSMEDPHWWSRDHDDNGDDNDGNGDEPWGSHPREHRWDDGPARPKRVSPP